VGHDEVGGSPRQQEVCEGSAFLQDVLAGSAGILKDSYLTTQRPKTIQVPKRFRVITNDNKVYFVALRHVFDDREIPDGYPIRPQGKGTVESEQDPFFLERLPRYQSCRFTIRLSRPSSLWEN
jgi:hypothetical protein